MDEAFAAGDLRIEVRHHCLPPNRYTWEIHSVQRPTPLKTSHEQFGSWEEASQAGGNALQELLPKIARPAR